MSVGRFVDVVRLLPIWEFPVVASNASLAMMPVGRVAHVVGACCPIEGSQCLLQIIVCRGVCPNTLFDWVALRAAGVSPCGALRRKGLKPEIQARTEINVNA